MIYQYVAYNNQGEVVKGKLSAINDQGANELLDYAGYRTISLKAYTPFFSTDSAFFQVSKTKPTDVILLYRQLAMLLESGTDVAASLDLLQQQISNKALQKILGQVVADVRGGSQLSESLEKHPKIFPEVYCRLISVGEQSGDLDTVLRQVADYMEKEITSSKQIKSALRMPLITVGIALVVVVLMILFILPSFADLYSMMGVELPGPVTMLIDAGDFAKANGLYLFGGALVVGIILYMYLRTPAGKYNLDKLMLSLPLIGKVRILGELARFCRSTALLFNSGLPLPDIIILSSKSSGSRVISAALMLVHDEMVQGEGLSGPMSKNKLFLPMMVQMVKVGEETGSLDKTLIAVANNFETEADDKTKSVIGLIQPVLTLVIGGIVGTLVMTLMSAMTSMYGDIA
ncbi:MAG: type II secretion system F family protein [Dehalococcoidales bacterium]|nr:type II secretion system F family protein [Dehalococcoidales bacterium]